MNNKTDVILFYPKVGDEAYAIPHMPLSVLAVGTAAQNKGYKVKIIDQRVSQNWKAVLKKGIEDGLLCVGISSMSGPQIKYAVEIAEYIRSISKDVLIVWGGVHASLLPEQTLESELVDIVVMREGEKTFPELLNALKGNGKLDGILSIAYKERSGKIKINSEHEFCDLDEYAFIDYNLIELKHYQKQGNERVPRADSVSLYTSRGCPFKCSFCYNSSFHHSKWRGQSVDVVVDNLQHLNKQGIRRIILCDEYFFQDLERAKAICRKILDNKLKIEFYFANCRADQVAKMTDDDLNLFAKAGFKDVFIGVESGSERILKLMQKKTDVNNAYEAGKRLTKAEISVQYSFMLGVPYEKQEDVKKTLQLMHRLITELPKCFVPGAGKFIPFPGTAAYNQSIDLGWVPPQSLKDWGDVVNVDQREWLGKKDGNIVEQSLFLTSALDVKINPRANRLLETMRQAYSKVARWRCKHGYINNVWEYKIMKSPIGNLLKKKRK